VGVKCDPAMRGQIGPDGPILAFHAQSLGEAQGHNDNSLRNKELRYHEKGLDLAGFQQGRLQLP
jgi:hypothetical protein